MNLDEPKTIPFQEVVKVSPRTYEQVACKHLRIVLDDVRRVVECEDCGIIIDPYDYLRSYAQRSFGHWSRMARNAKDMADRLTREIEELECRKRSLRASVRRDERKGQVAK